MTITITVKPRDPEAAHRRRTVAQRRAGVNAKCHCGEARPEALIRVKTGVICHACKRKQNGKTTKDKHHFAMKANSPVTVSTPVNDHAASDVRPGIKFEYSKSRPNRLDPLPRSACNVGRSHGRCQNAQG